MPSPTDSVPATMKAAAIDRYGPASVLKVHELDTPEPAPHQILIQIHTAGIGSWDAEMRSGSWKPPGRQKFPRVLGLDGSGVVVAKGARVTRFRLGDRSGRTTMKTPASTRSTSQSMRRSPREFPIA